MRTTSNALATWGAASSDQLDVIETALRAVRGTRGGSRHTTEQLAHAYALLLASKWQRFCRDLHTEGVAALLDRMQPAEALVPSRAVQDALRIALTTDRALDTKNAQRTAIAKDFSLFAVTFWKEVEGRDKRGRGRLKKVDELNVWRNAIAHHDFLRKNRTERLRARTVRSWRAACDALAGAMDAVVATQIGRLVGKEPW